MHDSNRIVLGSRVWYSPTGEEGKIVSINDAAGLFTVYWLEDGSRTTELLDNPSSTIIFDKTPRAPEELSPEQYIKAINKSVTDEYDVVSNPKHYQLFPEEGIEVRDLMQVLAAKMDEVGYNGMIVSDYIQAMQYFLRWFQKNGTEDIAKGIWYMNKITEQLGETDAYD